MNRFNILISSAGRRVALLQICRRALRNLGLEGDVLASDMSPLSAAFHHADRGILVPRCTDPDFAPRMLEICERESIRLVVPTIDTELPVFAAHRERFAAIGTTVLVSAPDVVALGCDKVLTHHWLMEAGLPTVRQWSAAEARAAADELPYPVIAKPRAGSSSIGVVRVGDAEALRTALARPDMIVQTVAPGIEYTIDFVVDRAGKCLCAVPRRRIEVRGGEVSKGVTVRKAVLDDIARRVCASLRGPYGTLCVQVFWDEVTGVLNVIELNPRFGGGFPLTYEAGGRFPEWLIEELLGRPSTAAPAAWRADLVMLRWDAAVFVDASVAGLR